MDYTARRAMLVYCSIATGYKGGGFNLSGTSNEAFRPEKVTAFEVGVRSEALNGRLRANFSVFYNDYKDQQLSQRVSASIITSNVDARTAGAEAELLFAPTAAWLLDANLSLLRTRFGRFLTVDSSNPAQNPDTRTPEVAVNIEGNRLPYAPQAKRKLGAQLARALPASGWKLTPRIDHVWQAAYYSWEFNTPNDRIAPWWVTNLQLRAASPGDMVQIRAHVKSATDKINVTSSVAEALLLGSYRNVRLLDPRTFGIQVEYRF